MTILAAIVVVAWVFGLGRTLLNLALVPRLKPRQLEREPFVSIIIPARNEERAIGRTVRALLAQTYGNLELIVVDDQSSDGTAAAVAEIAATDPRLTVVRGETPPAGWLGKPWALHQGSLRAKGELFFFIDADVVYAPEALAAAVAHMQRGPAVLLTLFPNFEMQGFWENVAMPQFAFAAFALMPSWLANRTTRPWLGIGGGVGNLVKRDAYAAADGHAALHQAVIDDVALARLVRAAGGRTEVVRAEELVSIRMYHGGRSIVEGMTKNMYTAIGRSLWIVPPFVVVIATINLLPYALLISAILHSLRGAPVTTAEWLGCTAVALLTLLRVILFASVRYPIANALFLHPLMIVFSLWVYVRSAWRTGVRGQVQWRGRTYDAADTRFGA
jgi:glycosyltransferase involved in cell wall biosynthesis